MVEVGKMEPKCENICIETHAGSNGLFVATKIDLFFRHNL